MSDTADKENLTEELKENSSRPLPNTMFKYKLDDGHRGQAVMLKKCK